MIKVFDRFFKLGNSKLQSTRFSRAQNYDGVISLAAHILHVELAKQLAGECLNQASSFWGVINMEFFGNHFVDSRKNQWLLIGHKNASMHNQSPDLLPLEEPLRGNTCRYSWSIHCLITRNRLLKVAGIE